MQLSLHAGRVQLHVLYNYDNIFKTIQKHFQIDSFVLSLVSCEQYMRMPCARFVELAEKISPFRVKQETCMRKSIGPKRKVGPCN